MNPTVSPLLLYLPGMEGTGKLFYRQEPELSRRYRVVSLPSRAVAPFQYEELVQDVLDAINQQGAEKAIIVAESFGGTVALQFALKHQERIDQLVLINTFPYFRRRLRLKLGRSLLPLTFHPFGNAIREFCYRRAMELEGISKEDVAKLFECSFSHGYEASRNRMRLLSEIDVRDRLSEITVPVMLVASARDKIVPSVSEAQFMAKRLQNARLIVLPEHGHTPLITTTFSLASLLQETT
jgi:pimeloyl-ACP methyl ester carboxylesterase